MPGWMALWIWWVVLLEYVLKHGVGLAGAAARDSPLPVLAFSKRKNDDPLRGCGVSLSRERQPSACFRVVETRPSACVWRVVIA